MLLRSSHAGVLPANFTAIDILIYIGACPMYGPYRFFLLRVGFMLPGHGSLWRLYRSAWRELRRIGCGEVVLVEWRSLKKNLLFGECTKSTWNGRPPSQHGGTAPFNDEGTGCGAAACNRFDEMPKTERSSREGLKYTGVYMGVLVWKCPC